jgi:hypothetical protein
VISNDHVLFLLPLSFTILVCFPCTLLSLLFYNSLFLVRRYYLYYFLCSFSHLHRILHLLNVADVSYVTVSTSTSFFVNSLPLRF